MTQASKVFFKKSIITCLFILSLFLIISSCATTQDTTASVQVSPENEPFVINEKTVKAMIEKAEPLIEEVTERKFKKRMKYELVKRDVIRDELIDDLIPQLKKLLNITNDDAVRRQAELTAQITSQKLLGKYSLSNKSFYIIPDNFQSTLKTLEINDDQIEDFVFLVVTHEMVHALDDQYFDLKKTIAGRTTIETSTAFNALMEGHAVYVTDKVADKLNISETAKQMSVNSAAGISGEANRIQQQTYHSIYVKGSEFVKAIIEKKGPAIITEAFTSPPYSTRQIMNPEEYLNPTAMANVDCSKIIEKVTEQLPIEGMGKQTLDLGGMILRTLLISKGISEAEAGSIANTCIGGGLTAAVKQVVKTSSSVSVLILNFDKKESAAKFDEISQKIDKSEIAQVNAKLNASYKILKEEDLNLEGYDVARCRHAESTVDDNITKKLYSTGIIDSMYIEIGFENMENLTEKDLVDILNRIYSEHQKMKEI